MLSRECSQRSQCQSFADWMGSAGTWRVTRWSCFRARFAISSLVIVFLLVSWLLRSSFGRIAVGIRENETRMALMGYDVAARKTVLFAVGAAYFFLYSRNTLVAKTADEEFALVADAEESLEASPAG